MPNSRAIVGAGLIAAIVVALFAAGLPRTPAQTQTESAAELLPTSGITATGERRSPAPVEVRPARALAAKQVSAERAARRARRLQPEEEAVLRLYDEMAEVLRMNHNDCDAMAYGLATTIAAGTPDARRLIHRVTPSTAEQSGKPDDPLVRAAVQHVEDFNTALNGALPACSAQLLPELQKLHEVD